MFGTSKVEVGRIPDERPADRGLGAFVRRHGLVSYHALTYFMSWLVWLPYVFSQHGLGILYPRVLGTTQFLGVLPGAANEGRALP